MRKTDYIEHGLKQADYEQCQQEGDQCKGYWADHAKGKDRPPRTGNHRHKSHDSNPSKKSEYGKIPPIAQP